MIMAKDPLVAERVQGSWMRHVPWPHQALFLLGDNSRQEEEDFSLEHAAYSPNVLNDTRLCSLPKFDRKRLAYFQSGPRPPWMIWWGVENIRRLGVSSSQADERPAPCPQGFTLQMRYDGDACWQDGAEEWAPPAGCERATSRFRTVLQGSKRPCAVHPVATRFGLRLAGERFAWWFIGDDDTFVNFPVLEKYLAKFDPAVPQLVSDSLNGGPGIAFSWAAAELLADEFWTVFVPMFDHVGREMYFHGDFLIKLWLGAGSRERRERIIEVESSPYFDQRQPSLTNLTSGEYTRTRATWHHCWRSRDLNEKNYLRYVYNDTC